MNRLQMLLQKLQEELAESIVEASKCQQFGIGDVYGNTTYNPCLLSNIQRLKRELNDVIAVCDMLDNELGHISTQYLLRRDPSAIIDKRGKVEMYLTYSKKVGIHT